VSVDVADELCDIDIEDVAVDPTVELTEDVCVVDGDVFSQLINLPSESASIAEFMLPALQLPISYREPPSGVHFRVPVVPKGPSYSFVIALSPSAAAEQSVGCFKNCTMPPPTSRESHSGEEPTTLQLSNTIFINMCCSSQL
jgi:hypothetical protein